MLISMDISYIYFLERVKGNSLLDGDKTILGINTLWSALLPVAKYSSIYFCYTAYIPAMHAWQLHAGIKIHSSQQKSS